MRGKRSVVLDLKDGEDLATAKRIVAGADVVVEAFGVNGAEQLGLGYEALAADNPGLVYTSITGFGHEGPYAHLKCYEAVFMAKTGSMYGNVALHRAGEPVMTNAIGGTMGAVFMAQQGTLIALHEKLRSGHGQRVDRDDDPGDAGS